MLASWIVWALLSASFAALTAIFAKAGVASVNPDMTTFVVVIAALGGLLLATGQWQAPRSLSARAAMFLVLSGLATGASWLCYFRALQLGEAAQVAPVDKLSVVLVAVFHPLGAGHRPGGGRRSSPPGLIPQA